MLNASVYVGDVTGTVGMGYAYYKGIGVEANYAKAIEILQKVVRKSSSLPFFPDTRSYLYLNICTQIQTPPLVAFHRQAH
jgi:hypothetical protein